MKLQERLQKARQSDLPTLWKGLGLPLRPSQNGRSFGSSWAPCCGHGNRPDATSVFVGKSNIWRYHCFRCGSGGTAIDVVMAVKKVGEVDAATMLVENAIEGHRVATATPLRPTVDAVDPKVIGMVIGRLREALQGRLDVDLCEALLGRGIKAQTLLDAADQGVLLTLPAQPARAEATLRVMVGPELLAEAGMLKGKWTAAAFRPLVVVPEGNRMLEFRRVGDGEGPKALQYGDSAPLVFRQDAEGRDVKQVVVVEGLIDTLSIHQMATRRNSLIVGLLGAAKFRPEWWSAMAYRHPNATWLIGTDADKSGDEAAARIAETLPAGVPHKRLRPTLKDWNDVLVAGRPVAPSPSVRAAA